MTHNSGDGPMMGSRNVIDAFSVTGRNTPAWRAVDLARRARGHRRLIAKTNTPLLRGGAVGGSSLSGELPASPSTRTGQLEEIRARRGAGEAESPSNLFKKPFLPPLH